jgi:hypothetical protein
MLGHRFRSLEDCQAPVRSACDDKKVKGPAGKPGNCRNTGSRSKKKDSCVL